MINSTDQDNRLLRWVGIGFILGLFVILIFVWFRVGFQVQWNPQNAYQLAAETWQNNSIESYDITVLVRKPFFRISGYDITVENGDVTGVLAFNPRTYLYDPNPPRFDVPISQVGLYTIPSLLQQAGTHSATFDRLHIYVPSRETSHIIYDATYGYPKQIIDNSCGVFLTLVDECVTRIDVVRFTPSQPEPSR